MPGVVVADAGDVNTTPIQITLELQPDGDTVAGRARCNGSEREFSGRIGLMALVDSLLDEALEEGDDQTKDGETNADS